jgi:hypothetical protein
MLSGVQITWQAGSSTRAVSLYGRVMPRYGGQMPIRNWRIETPAAKIVKRSCPTQYKPSCNKRCNCALVVIKDKSANLDWS